MLEDLLEDSYIDRKTLEYMDRETGDGEIGIIGHGRRIRRNSKSKEEEYEREKRMSRSKDYRMW